MNTKRLTIRFEDVDAAHASELTESLKNWLSDDAMVAQPAPGDPKVRIEPGHNPDAQGSPTLLMIDVLLASTVHGVAMPALHPFTSRLWNSIQRWWIMNGEPPVVFETAGSAKRSLRKSSDARKREMLEKVREMIELLETQ